MVGLGKKTGVKVADRRAVAAIKTTKPDVAVLCTSSSLKKVWPQIETRPEAEGADRLDDRGALVPWFSNRALARKIDAAAKKAKVAVLGTGVNPGFAMDALPIALTAVCERVDAMRDRPRPGRAHPPAAVPAEDRLRPHRRAVRGRR